MAESVGAHCLLNDKLPPPQGLEYEAKGGWEDIGGLKTYVAGARNASMGIVFVYDAFGLSPQVLQGADRLSGHLGALVLVPDFFKGQGPTKDEFEKDRDAARAKFHKLSDHAMNTQVALDFTKSAANQYPSRKSWGVFGLCWGGKIAILAANAKNSPFMVSGQAHPGYLDVADAKALRAPHICLPSRDEAAEVVADFATILEQGQKGKVVSFSNMHHGWMGARACQDNESKQEFERGYLEVARFFHHQF